MEHEGNSLKTENFEAAEITLHSRYLEVQENL